MAGSLPGYSDRHLAVCHKNATANVHLLGWCGHVCGHRGAEPPGHAVTLCGSPGEQPVFLGATPRHVSASPVPTALVTVSSASGHFSGREVVPSGCPASHSRDWYRACSQVLTGRLHVIGGTMSTPILYPFLNWALVFLLLSSVSPLRILATSPLPDTGFAFTPILWLVFSLLRQRLLLRVL